MDNTEAIEIIKTAIAKVEWDYPMEYAAALDKAVEALKEQETVVRCKDCKYNSGNCHGLYAQFVTCYKTGSPHMENWYCADGERR